MCGAGDGRLRETEGSDDGSVGFLPIDSEWWHFTLANEPYPDTYFDFPITQTEEQ